MKIAICGHGECGKDFAAEYLAKRTGLRYACGTSRYAADIVFEKWGYQFWTSAQEGWENRREHREKWASLIGEYNAADPVQLYRDCLANQEILTGIRWEHERRAIHEAGLVDLWLWVDADVRIDPTMTFDARKCDFSIFNCKTGEFCHRLDRLVRGLGKVATGTVCGFGINDTLEEAVAAYGEAAATRLKEACLKGGTMNLLPLCLQKLQENLYAKTL